LRAKHIDLQFNANVASITPAHDDARRVRLTDGRELEADLVLYAIGRRPNVADLGLAEAGVELNIRGAIEIERRYRTSVSNIFAVGDVTDRLQLTPVALAEGMAVAENLFNGADRAVEYADIPTAVFCQPNIGTVGLTEADARLQRGEIRVFESIFRPLKATVSGRDERCFMKLVVDANSDRVVGAHMVGEDAGEIIQGVAVALKAGATKAQFDDTIGIHPTAAEEFVTMREPVR
jgi:glutathione reductase (NADPH)